MAHDNKIEKKMRRHMELDGKTPVETAGAHVTGEDKRRTIHRVRAR
jgi:hypothetical protein